MSGVTRRTMLGGTIGAAIATPAAARTAIEASGALLNRGEIEQDFPIPPEPRQLSAAELLFSKHQELQWKRQNFRVGGFDPDIYEMRSLSWHAKANRQIKRDESRQTVIEKLREALPKGFW